MSIVIITSDKGEQFDKDGRRITESYAVRDARAKQAAGFKVRGCKLSRHTVMLTCTK